MNSNSVLGNIGEVKINIDVDDFTIAKLSAGFFFATLIALLIANQIN